MSAASGVADLGPPPGLARLQRGSLVLLGLGGGFVLVEPSPFEVLFGVAFVLHALGGLRIGAALAPLILALAVFCVGGLLSLVPFVDQQRPVQFVAISIYLALVCIAVAVITRDDTLGRVRALLWGLVWGSACASVAGILGYFDVAGLGGAFTLYNRASGTFKDPNVLGTFAALPLVFLTHELLTGRPGRLRNCALALLILFGSVFLSFSRGAWLHAAASIALMTALTFLQSRDARLRGRIAFSAAVGALVVAGGLAVALSFDAVSKVFEVRASLEQSYDLGEQGRFGSQARSVSLLLERPNGFGPMQFRTHFPEDPHNVYVNAFASYGWLGGLAYFGLVVMTLFVGWRVALAPAPWRPVAVVIWSTLFVQILQGVQIDTDHWRHWYLMVGLVWGLLATGRARGLYLRTTTKA